MNKLETLENPPENLERVSIYTPMNLDGINGDCQLALVLSDSRILTDPNITVKDFRGKSIAQLLETLDSVHIAILLEEKTFKIEVSNNIGRNNLKPGDPSETLSFLNVVSPEIAGLLTDINAARIMEQKYG